MQPVEPIAPTILTRFAVRHRHLRVATLVLAFVACGGRSDPSGGGGLMATIAVKPFRTGDSLPRSWDFAAFDDSLAAGLSRVQGLGARVANESMRDRDDFTLNGEVDSRDGRLVIATRLRRAGEDADMWTATYWRADEPISRLVAYLTVPITEAVFRDLGRRAATSSKDER